MLPLETEMIATAGDIPPGEQVEKLKCLLSAVKAAAPESGLFSADSKRVPSIQEDRKAP